MRKSPIPALFPNPKLQPGNGLEAVFRAGLSGGRAFAPVWYSRCFVRIPLPNLVSGEHPMSMQPTVADFIVGRLAREGITDCFGVPDNCPFDAHLDIEVAHCRIEIVSCVCRVSTRPVPVRRFA